MALAFSNLKKGARKIRENPQLFYTIVVAVLIAGAFVLMAERFVRIANDAQERLVNVRIGSLQDAFVAFARDSIGDPENLERKIAEVSRSNETIKSFKIFERRLSTSSPAVFAVIASKDPTETGSSDPGAEFLYSLASSDPRSSFTLESTDGKERLFHTARAIEAADGSVLGVAVTTQTLSQADKAIESSIQRSIAILVAVLIVIMLLFLRHSRIIDYSTLYRKLKEVDQLKDDFISMASHELRTPLSSIRGYAEFIREAPDLSADTKQYAERIDVSAKDLDSLVADILDVSRIEQGRMSFKTERLDASSAVKDVVSSLSLPAKDKGLALSFESKAPEAAILADKDRLRQALTNIIGNAVKYTKQGEVKAAVYAEGGKLFVRISDTGVGMSAEEQKRLFEKFYRIRTKDTEDIKGTGLGLWITAQIIREMKGSISVESIKGVGSHFIIAFPLA
ncbi:MAG: HAMP domain-containing histidine kinase [Candidatus Taylorbacteria bacterium]|nr:HAMP domain-containing histidine kinase [Candidatus Taylorbacteria bacterium]